MRTNSSEDDDEPDIPIMSWSTPADDAIEPVSGSNPINITLHRVYLCFDAFQRCMALTSVFDQIPTGTTPAQIDSRQTLKTFL